MSTPYGKELRQLLARVTVWLPITTTFFLDCFEKSPELEDCRSADEFSTILVRHLNHYNIRDMKEELKTALPPSDAQRGLNEISALLAALGM